MAEIISGRAELCDHFFLLLPSVIGFQQIQKIPIGLSVEIVFVVPKPRQIESWRLFQYIFQWKVCVGIGLVMFLLSCAALMFVRVHSGTNTSSGSSEIVSLWNAALSLPVNKLPMTHSQRLLIVLSLLLGLVFLTLFSAQLFTLVKAKPRLASIKTLRDVNDSNLPIYTVRGQFLAYLSLFENTTLHNLKDNLRTDQMYDKD